MVPHMYINIYIYIYIFIVQAKHVSDLLIGIPVSGGEQLLPCSYLLTYQQLWGSC